MNQISTPDVILEIVLGTLILIVVIFVHGAGIRTINRRFSKAWIHVDSAMAYWRVDTLLALVIGSMTVLHLAETLIWAMPIYAFGLIPSLRDSYYYVLESYTTLGEGNVSLPDKWRLIGPIIAMSGLFTFGWTGSVLVSIMSELGKLDRTRAEQRGE